METAISISFVGFSFVLAYISLNLRKQHSILSWMFLPLSLITFVVNVFLLGELTSTVSVENIIYNYGYAMILIFIFVVMYFVLFVIMGVYEKLTNKYYGKG